MMGRREQQKKTGQQPSRQKAQEELKLPLPHEVQKMVQEIVQKIADSEGKRVSNPGLWLDRFLPVDRNRNWELSQTAKQRKKVLDILRQSPQFDGLVKALKQRQGNLLEWFQSKGFPTASFCERPSWRFVVGLGAAHVLETGISLHRLFGLPIIPGSGLKGCARAFAMRELAKQLGIPIPSPAEANPNSKTPFDWFVDYLEEPNRKSRKKLWQELKKRLEEKSPANALSFECLEEATKLFRRIFGNQAQAGEIVFLDAVPMEVPRLTLDIMNPHYPDYYRTKGEKPPADYDSPNPVFFLTVEKTPYFFALAGRTREASELMEQAERWLKGALRELGIGAKTSAGYGYWEPT